MCCPSVPGGGPSPKTPTRKGNSAPHLLPGACAVGSAPSITCNVAEKWVGSDRRARLVWARWLSRRRQQGGARIATSTERSGLRLDVGDVSPNPHHRDLPCKLYVAGPPCPVLQQQGNTRGLQPQWGNGPLNGQPAQTSAQHWLVWSASHGWKSGLQHRPQLAWPPQACATCGTVGHPVLHTARPPSTCAPVGKGLGASGAKKPEETLPEGVCRGMEGCHCRGMEGCH